MIDFGNAPKSSAQRIESALRDRESHEDMLKFHLDFLDDYSVGIARNDVVLLGAATGAGKTALAKTIAQRNVLAGKRVTYFALEAERGEIENRIAYELIAQRCRDTNTSPRGMSYARWYCRMYPELIEAENKVRQVLERDYQNLFTFYKQGDFDQSALTKEFYAAHASSDLLILDHLHYVDSHETNENRAYKELVKCVRDLALECDTPILCVAHLRKKDRGAKMLVPDVEDFHGSSDLIKIATKCVVLAPAYDQDMQHGIAGTYFHVGKDRRVGSSKYAGLCGYDLQLNQYAPGYRLGRLSYMSDSWEAVKISDFPDWAKNAITPTISVSYE